MKFKNLKIVTTLFIVGFFFLLSDKISFANQTNQATYSGIKPISPVEFFDRLSLLLSTVTEAAKPFVNRLGQFMIALSGLAGLGVLFGGSKIAGRIAASIFFVGVGILVFNNTETLIGLWLWVSQFGSTISSK